MMNDLEQYLLLVSFNLAILLLLMLSFNVNKTRYVFRMMAAIMGAHELVLLLRFLSLDDYIPTIYRWVLIPLLWGLILVLAITMLAIVKVRR